MEVKFLKQNKLLEIVSILIEQITLPGEIFTFYLSNKTLVMRLQHQDIFS